MQISLIPTTLLTGVVTCATYASWVLLILYGNSWPLLLLFAAGGYIVCLHGSLQHLAVHGQLSDRKWLNTVLAYPPLAIYFPYPIYLEEHTNHHNCDVLTDADTDPESLYVDPEHWSNLGSISKWIYRINFTVGGRMLIGPAVSLYLLCKNEIHKFIEKDYRRAGTWSLHFALSATILAFAYQVGGIPPWKYLLCFAFPGVSLTLLRSYTEHRWSDTETERSIVVEGSPVSQLLYLNNNFHWVHHENPGLPWYQLPAVFEERKESILQSNGNFYYSGYFDILRRIWKDKLINPIHPNSVA